MSRCTKRPDPLLPGSGRLVGRRLSDGVCQVPDQKRIGALSTPRVSSSSSSRPDNVAGQFPDDESAHLSEARPGDLPRPAALTALPALSKSPQSPSQKRLVQAGVSIHTTKQAEDHLAPPLGGLEPAIRAGAIRSHKVSQVSGVGNLLSSIYPQPNQDAAQTANRAFLHGVQPRRRRGAWNANRS